MGMMDMMKQVGIDAPCVALCKALNNLHGVQTRESCCGHLDRPYQIWLTVESLNQLRPIAWALAPCHSACYGWRLIVQTDCTMAALLFCVEGPQGGQAYDDAQRIADVIADEIETGATS